ncbi:hypothetical protein RJI07_09145 [Mycoplasmatota bacterium WC30]
MESGLEFVGLNNEEAPQLYLIAPVQNNIGLGEARLVEIIFL